ncbi:MAG: DUF3095 domain-containing protein [Pseudomonadota bacterium]
MWYDDLPRYDAFSDLTHDDSYTPLPPGWVVGCADIIGSTGLIAAGRYKEVNMIGAAVISSQINGAGDRAFPFVFGGDGAAFAHPPEHRATAEAALAATQAWSSRAFGIETRVAMMPIEDIRAAGYEVAVARHAASEHVDYAMITGGGLAWAEAQMKAGAVSVPPAPEGAEPDLTGLSCRWSHMPSTSGTILSILVEPVGDAAAFAEVSGRVLELVRGLDRGGHPAPPEGPGVGWPPAGAVLEARVPGMTRAKVLAESLLAKLLVSTGLKPGGFDARRYRRVVGENADFRKFDDGLKMTLDVDPATAAALRTLLDEAEAAGTLRYGWHQQDEAMMTCIVPSPLLDNHVHFIDGAAGGYAQAALRLKGQG